MATTDNENLNLIKKLLSPKEFRKCETVFGNGGDKRFKNEWSCFTNTASWIQFFHDILILSNGIRSAVLIDYNVPEWDDLCEFLNYLKSKLSTMVLPQLSNIQLIYLDDYLFFLVNIETLIEKSNNDLLNSFSNYQFIDVSTHNQLPIICKLPELSHHKILIELVNVITKNGSSCNINLNNYSNELNLKNIYYPIISGWLCEYPIIYCNSGCFKECNLINTDNISNLSEDWDNNNLCGNDLIKVEVQLQIPINNDILKVQSIQRLLAFTYPETSSTNLESILINYENRISKRFQSSTIIKQIWNNISFLKQPISMTTIRL